MRNTKGYTNVAGDEVTLLFEDLIRLLGRSVFVWVLFEGNGMSGNCPTSAAWSGGEEIPWCHKPLIKCVTVLHKDLAVSSQDDILLHLIPVMILWFDPGWSLPTPLASEAQDCMGVCVRCEVTVCQANSCFQRYMES